MRSTFDLQGMQLNEASEVRRTAIGRHLVIEPPDDSADEGAFRRAMAAVLRRDAVAFQALAEFDQGERTANYSDSR